MSRYGKAVFNNTSYAMLKNRELGLNRTARHMDGMSYRLYQNIGLDKFKYESKCMDKGGVFNMEFSLDGKLLVTTCQEKAMVLFDANTKRIVNKVQDTHEKCVNCVKYLDDYNFATGSDDGVVKVWDTRNLTESKNIYRGHSNWVKSIDYSRSEQVMVTSALDGSVYGWDMTKAKAEKHEKIFRMNGLMRTKLTPDGTKMIIATTGGYLILVHDLNVSTLARELGSFRPNLYRLMQVSDQTFPAATMYNFLFSQERTKNRIELIDDFPNTAEVVNTIQVNPMGTNVLSRNISPNEGGEWTSVHDIKTRNPKEYADAYSYVEESALPEHNPSPRPFSRPSDIWMGCMTNENYISDRPTFCPRNDVTSFIGVMSSGLGGTQNDRLSDGNNENKIIRNIPRLTYHIQEMTVGKGYIKEPCFSADGRIICSPYGNGIRLLTFNKQMQDLSYCAPMKPKKLHALNVLQNTHRNPVVCCKFNPVNNYQLATGCLGGDVVWYTPNF